jgi:hypothetical protein
MPRAWADSLAGRTAPDLRAARLLAQSMLLWHGRGGTARAGAGLAARLLAARVCELSSAERPALLAHGALAPRVFAVNEPVVDVPSLVSALVSAHAGAIGVVDWQHAHFLRDVTGRVSGVDHDGLLLRAATTVLCAGAGNQQLLARLDARTPSMQRRPLRQVLVKDRVLRPLYGHCIGSHGQVRLTVTSHRHRDGAWVWYLGGGLAERGASLEPAALIEAARAELSELFPTLDLAHAAWRTQLALRAEPAARGRRPDDVFVGKMPGAPGAVVAWPVKLALVPRMAERVEALLGAPAGRGDAHGPHPALQHITTCARPPWEELFP